MFSTSTEALTPLILETLKQFNFSHVLAGAGAFGKVTISDEPTVLMTCTVLKLHLMNLIPRLSWEWD